MKYPIGILTSAILVAAFALSGCDSPSNKMEDAETSVIEANRDLEIATSEVEAELSIYRAEVSDRIMEFNRTISGIKQKIENESDMDVRVNLEKELNGLEVTHRELKREMDNYKASGRENWDDFKDSYSNRMDDLGDSLKDLYSNTNTTLSTN